MYGATGAFDFMMSRSMSPYVRYRSSPDSASGEQSIAEIASDAGYSSQAHFTRAFRRHTGVPPGTYRALIRR